MNNFIINPDDKFFPKANEWMWNYCIFLGKFTDSQGTNYDLGIWKNRPIIEKGEEREIEERWSAAIVDGNEAGSYYSGDFYHVPADAEHYEETLRRARILNIIDRKFIETCQRYNEKTRMRGEYEFLDMSKFL